MSEQLVGALIGIVTTIIGGVFGFLLSEIGTSRREAREAKARARSVRLIVGLEAERNLAALKTLWETIKAQGDPSQVENDSTRSMLTRVFTDSAPMSFSRESLDTQLPELPGALPYETITRLFALYDTFGRVQSIRQELLGALADQQAEMSRFRQSQTAPGQPMGLLYAPRTPFDNKAAQIWDDLARAIQNALEQGNPITFDKTEASP